MSTANYKLTPPVTLLADESLEMTHEVGSGPVSYRVLNEKGEVIRSGTVQPDREVEAGL